MAKARKPKPARARGKISLSKYFQIFSTGDRVAVVKDTTFHTNVPQRIQGRSGVVVGKRGKAYLVKINDQAKEKLYIVPPIHLKKLASSVSA